MLSLKINLTTQGKIKTMQFPGNIAIHTIVQKIKEETQMGESADHALYDPEHKRWLKMEKTLFYYDIPSNHVLEFKKKHRPLKLKMLDGTLKTVLIDESLSVQQLVDFCCDKLQINNPEEFSLGMEVEVDEKEKQKKEKDKELSSLTDQAFRWLNPDQALCEQNITNEDVLVLKKKFYFSDQNVDRNDPVQLNLVYTQARNQILSEKHPCTFEEAIQFAAIQCQVQFGNNDPTKHKPGFLEVKDFLPPEYQRSKDVEKRVFAEHSKLGGMNDLNAKYRYVQLSRSLRTYGVTFYLVKEKTKKKGVLEPVLLGITKEKIMRFDVKTKEVVHSWALTTLRRWAATPNSLTLDFGDHSDAYYTVQTAEGDVISQLIGGYIDIILKKRRDGERKVEDGAEEMAMTESIQRAPKMETASLMAFKEQKAQMKSFGNGQQSMKPSQTVAQVVKIGFATHQVSGNVMKKNETQKIEMSSFDAVQQHLQSGFAAINSACVELQYPSAIQPLDTETHPEASVWKKEAWFKHAANINSRMVKHVESTSILLNQAILNKESLDLDLVGGSIYTLSSNLSQLAAEAKMIGCFAEDQDQADRILDSTRRIGASTAEWLLACQNALEAGLTPPELYKASQSLVDTVDELINLLGTKNSSDEDRQYVLSAAQNITVEFSHLIEESSQFKGELSSVNKTKFENALLDLKTACAHVLAVAKSVLPMLDVTECTTQAIYAAKNALESSQAMSGFLDDNENEGFAYACQQLNGNIERLVSLLDGSQEKNVGNLSEKVQKVLSLTTEANQVSYDADALLAKIKEITVASAELSAVITASINQSNDPKEIERLKAAAKDAAKKTNDLVQETRKWTKDPDNDDLRMGVLKSVGKLQLAMKSVSGDTRENAIENLLEMAQKSILNVSGLLNACSGAALSNNNPAGQKQLMQAARKTFIQNTDLAGSVVELKEDIKNVQAQLKLINAATDSVKTNENLLKAVKFAKDFIADPSIKKQVSDGNDRVIESMEKVKSALATISCFGDIGGPEYVLDSILDGLKKGQKEINEVNSDLTLLDKENVLGDIRQLQDDLKQNAKAAFQELLKIKNFSQEGNDQGVGGSAQDMTSYLSRVTNAGKQVAAILGLEKWNEDTDEQQAQLISNLAKSYLPLIAIVEKARNALGKKGDRKEMEDDIAKFQNALTALMASLPEQKELEKVINQVSEVLSRPVANNSQEPEEAKNKLFQSSSQMSNAYNQLVNAHKLPHNELLKIMNDMTKHHSEIVSSALAISNQLDNEEDRQRIRALLSEISESSSSVLGFSKRASSVVLDDVQLKDTMLGTSQKLGTAIQELLQIVSQVGNEDEQMAKINIKKAVEKGQDIIKNCNVPPKIIDSYDKISDDVAGALDKVLAALDKLRGDLNKNTLEAVSTEAEKATIEFASALAKALYVVALNDFDTVQGTPGFVDCAVQEAGYERLKERVEQLKKSKTPQEVAQVTADIAKITNSVMLLCKELAADKTGKVSPTDQQYFMQYAQYIGQSVQGFVGAVKLFSTAMNDENRQQTMAHANGIAEGIKGIVQYLKEPQFNGTPTQFGSKALVMQKPIQDSAKKFFRALDGSGNALTILSLNPQNTSILGQIATNAKVMNDSKNGILKSLEEQSPGKKKLEQIADKLQNTLIDLDAALLKCATEGLTKSPDAQVNQTMDAADMVATALNDLDHLNLEPAYISKQALQLNDLHDMIMKQMLAEASIRDNKATQCDIVGLLKDLTEAFLDLQLALKDMNSSEIAEKREKVYDKLDDIKGYWVQSESLDKLVESAKSQISAIHGNILKTYPTSSGAIVPLAAFLNDCRELILSIGSFAGVIGKENPDFESKIPAIPSKLQSMQPSLCIALKVAEVSTKNEIDSNLKALVLGLCTYLDMMRNAFMRPADGSAKSSLSSASRDVSTRVGALINSVKNANPGLSQTENAVSKINDDVMAGIESTMVFAEAGQLEPSSGDKPFKEYHGDIQVGVKRLIEDVKGIVSATAQSMNNLGDFSGKSAKHLEEVWALSKSAIASVTSADKLTQIELLKSAAAMSQSMNELISTAMQVCGKPQNDPEFATVLPQAAKKAAQQIAVFYKAVESVSDEKTRALKAITAVMGDLKFQEDAFLSDQKAEGYILFI
eukprot:NODE_53_length_30760_cov_1.203712.p1 type:complete len:2138 gc:universal NODE_53_length_30760_cov_1.203712:1939-8352(+)